MKNKQLLSLFITISLLASYKIHTSPASAAVMAVSDATVNDDELGDIISGAAMTAAIVAPHLMRLGLA